MSEVREMILSTVDRFMANSVPAELLEKFQPDTWYGSLWREVEEAGLPLAAVSEAGGGVGLRLDDALAMLRPLAGGSVPLPVGETIVARWLAEKAGIALGDGPHMFAPGEPQDTVALSRHGEGFAVRGTAHRVPWARHAASVLIHLDWDGRSHVARIQPGQWRSTPGQNLAGEPRDDIAVEVELDAADVRPLDGFTAEQWLALGAAMRSVQIAGAVQRALDLTVTYVGERSQFGRKLQQFQAVQQNLALMAGQVASANAAAELAMEAAGRGVRTAPIAAAKIRCGEAARLVAQLGHQLHGAIGFTAEYSLQLATRRLWSWRDEFGDESHWAESIGRQVCGEGGAGVWPWITAATSYGATPASSAA